MVFEGDHERAVVVEELGRLGARADLVAWVADPTTDLTTLSAAVAVPFWDEVLRRMDLRAARSGPVPEPVFSLALHAYLDCWRAESEQRELFEAAEILGRAAQERLSSRGHFAD